jgi:hypothetical protein
MLRRRARGHGSVGDSGLPQRHRGQHAAPHEAFPERLSGQGSSVLVIFACGRCLAGPTVGRTLCRLLAGDRGDERTTTRAAAAGVVKSPASVSCELSAGNQSLMPLWVDVHCPRLIRDILALKRRSVDASRQPLVLRLIYSAGQLVSHSSISWSSAGAVSVIDVSEEYRLVLVPASKRYLLTSHGSRTRKRPLVKFTKRAADETSLLIIGRPETKDSRDATIQRCRVEQ